MDARTVLKEIPGLLEKYESMNSRNREIVIPSYSGPWLLTVFNGKRIVNKIINTEEELKEFKQEYEINKLRDIIRKDE